MGMAGAVALDTRQLASPVHRLAGPRSAGRIGLLGQHCQAVAPVVMRLRTGNPAAAARTPCGHEARRRAGIETGIGHQPGGEPVRLTFVAAHGQVIAALGVVFSDMAKDVVRQLVRQHGRGLVVVRVVNQ